VGHHGGEAPHGGEPPAAFHLPAEALQFREIPEEGDAADQRPLVVLQDRRDRFEGNRPPFSEGTFEFFLDDGPLRRQPSHQLQAFGGKDVLCRLADRLCRAAAEQFFRRVVQNHHASPRIDGQESHGHVLDEAVREGLDPGQGNPGGAVSQGHQQGDDAGHAEQQEHRGRDDRAARILGLRGLNGRHVQADEDHIGPLTALPLKAPVRLLPGSKPAVDLEGIRPAVEIHDPPADALLPVYGL